MIEKIYISIFLIANQFSKIGRSSRLKISILSSRVDCGCNFSIFPIFPERRDSATEKRTELWKTQVFRAHPHISICQESKTCTCSARERVSRTLLGHIWQFALLLFIIFIIFKIKNRSQMSGEFSHRDNLKSNLTTS